LPVAALLAGCAGSDGGGPVGTPRSSLRVLPRSDTTPPPARTFAVRNHQVQTFHFEHTDGMGTLFAEFRFTPHSIVQAGGLPVSVTCTVLVTATLLAGLYGFTIGPSDLVSSSSGSPTVRPSHGLYGELSVHDSTTRCPTAADYSAALAIWYERAPDLWQDGRNSAHESPTVVASALDAPITHLLAALT
jgi:hypothetical protein